MLFLNKPIHLGPCGSIFFSIQRSALCLYVFCIREFFADEEMSKGLIASQTNPPTSIYKRWFHK
ncbi:Protein ycf2 [Apostasia shenzhenica]|uniref:Protein ycf2 n=1 Tax=Apostasia shenzhenica TaxID=1088818 RepID=A0A2I0B3A2_9ASPA|nr:Protein ycf2 [Apostasia shenzhenica]